MRARPDAVNILLVDDQPAKLLSYEVMLEELGETLIKATSGREALAHLLKTRVAVILIDVSMPDLDGFELAAMIRGHPRFQTTRDHLRFSHPSDRTSIACAATRPARSIISRCPSCRPSCARRCASSATSTARRAQLENLNSGARAARRGADRRSSKPPTPNSNTESKRGPGSERRRSRRSQRCRSSRASAS